MNEVSAQSKRTVAEATAHAHAPSQDTASESALGDHLVVIDAQAVFADPAVSPWGSPLFGKALPNIVERVRQYGERVTFTRFVAPREPEGAWVDYYREWPFALVDDDDPLYALVQPFTGRPTIDCTTFGKWGARLASAIGGAKTVELVGVSTDCCVISTALAMADAGQRTQVWLPGCAGSTEQNHDNAVAVMELYCPLITVVR